MRRIRRMRRRMGREKEDEGRRGGGEEGEKGRRKGEE